MFTLSVNVDTKLGTQLKVFLSRSLSSVYPLCKCGYQAWHASQGILFHDLSVVFTLSVNVDTKLGTQLKVFSLS